ncbi:TRIC cation channel family protein [Meiothermus sp.]|uniref:trimeric intracellular cation channel family protein n=1 Tax=Meiothermus sp. TaxID=1955249 RepID=UPI00307F705C
MQHWQFLDLLSWAGILAFGASGALVAVQKRFDLVGIIVLTGVTAIGGGAIRDVLVGTLPPQSLRNEAILWVVFLIALGVWRFYSRMGRLERPIYYFDTLGLGLFAALGAERALAFGLGFWGCVFVGTVSGVGGGVLRDVLAGEIPGIFYRNRDLYASAATAGAAVVFLIYTFIPAYSALAIVLGALVTIGLRLSSRWLGLRLPTPGD